jgi:predicted small secreted protein
MKQIISISSVALAAFLLAGCVENDVMHVGSVVTPSSSAGQTSSSSPSSPMQDVSVAQKHMENRTF